MLVIFYLRDSYFISLLVFFTIYLEPKVRILIRQNQKYLNDEKIGDFEIFVTHVSFDCTREGCGRRGGGRKLVALSPFYIDCELMINWNISFEAPVWCHLGSNVCLNKWCLGSVRLNGDVWSSTKCRCTPEMNHQNLVRVNILIVRLIRQLWHLPNKRTMSANFKA